ncbi:MAG: hypothetical protein JSS79_05285 [Bacteroidetes bacterium]|nr:hypothetical protein [Bacteroidota bacterium]
MALTLNPTPLYGGEVYGKIVSKLFQTHKLYQAGKLYVQGGFKYKFSIPLSDPTYAVQAAAPTPTSSGSLNYKDRVLALSDYMFYQEFNPRVLEAYWRPFQPTGPLVFEQLPADVQANMLMEIFGYLGQYHGQKDVTGSKSGGDFYDGFLTKITAASGDYANAVTVNLPGTISTGGTSGTAANVLSAFNAAKQAAMFGGNPQLQIAYINRDADWTWIVSPQTATLWGDYQKINQVYKGEDPTGRGKMEFDGRPIIVQPNFPENTIFGTYMTAGTDSNVWIGVADTSDENTINVQRVQNNSELYFAKMLMKRDTAIVRPEHCVIVK